MIEIDPNLLPHQPLEGRTILLGVTGGIAAYKAADLASNLVQLGASVHVLMTRAATSFVTPATFAALTQNRVHDDVLERWHGDFTGHISLGQSADTFIVAPATANTIAHLALGLAEDMIGATALATTAPLVVAPAMEHAMFHHPATQGHLEILRSRGATIVGPDRGRLASGEFGDGRLSPVTDLTGAVRNAVGSRGPLAGRRVVVTAGGTHEAIDPVRYIGNNSSGRMGYALAQSVLDAGGTVVLITAPTAIPLPYGVEVVNVVSAADMQTAVTSHAADADAILMTAAVADYRPAASSLEKIKKTAFNETLTIDLVRNPDIIGSLADAPLIKIGFAAETNDHITFGTEKLRKKRLGMVVVNDAVDTIGSKTSTATLLTPNHQPERFPELIKERLAARIVDRLAQLLNDR